MIRLAVALILCLVPILGAAQNVNLALDVRPWFARQSVNLHDGALTSSWQKTRWELSAASFLSPQLHVKYVIVPGLFITETQPLTMPLLVGATDFGPVKDAKEATQVQFDWSLRDSHRLEVTGWTSTPIKPVFICEWNNLSLTATSTKDGKTTTDTESFSKFLAAAGGMLSYTNTNISTNLILVGSKEFTRFEARLLYRFSFNGSITGGYAQEQRDFGGVKIREQGPFLSILWAF